LARSGYRLSSSAFTSGPDVDTIDRHVLDLAVDVDVEHCHAAPHDMAYIDAPESGVSQVNGAELRAAQVDPLEPGIAEVLTDELSHIGTVMTASDNRASQVAVVLSGLCGSTEQSLWPLRSW